MTGAAPVTARRSWPQASERLQSLLLWGVLGLLVLAVPLTYFAFAYGALSAALQTKAEVKAELVSQLIARSPQLWHFEQPRLAELIERLPVPLHNEHAAVLSETEEVVAESSAEVDAPVVSRSALLFDAGRPVGQVEMQGSLRELLLHTALAALFGLALGAIVFGALRNLQRGNRRIAAAMFDQQERARVTLQSIGDAVVTTDLQQCVDFMNPVAERLTQWPLSEARGRPLSEVCPLIDERAMQTMPALVPRAMEEGRNCPFTGRDVALVRRDGSMLAIEDSAAPIRGSSGAIIGAAMVFRDVTATRRMARRINWAATHDALTGLVNRREFESRVDAALQAARTSGRQQVVCYLDLDRFKMVNDSCGHAAGDALLKQLSDLLQGRLRESDTLARMGGDEFGVLLEGCTPERAELIAADLLAAVRDYRFVWEGRIFSLGVSIGLVSLTADTLSRTEVFSAADAACYLAKEQGRNRVVVYRNGDIDLAQRRAEMGWAARLNAALEEERFVLFYQPYLPLGAGEASGLHVELLLRLVDESGHLVLPSSFLPAAERYNIMPAIDRWVIRTAFSRYRELVAVLGEPLTCAINLSGSTLSAAGMLDFIADQARLHQLDQLPSGSLCFEITESAAIHNLRAATEFMQAVRTLGFGFALDDFGVGSSSMAHLKALPVDYLKIDGSFIRNMARDPIDRAMAETLNRVGHIMGLQTVGEHAETEEAVRALRQMGVDFAQGYGVQVPKAFPGDWPALRAGTRI